MEWGRKGGFRGNMSLREVLLQVLEDGSEDSSEEEFLIMQERKGTTTEQ